MKKEKYTERQIQIANFATLMSQPVRIFILQKFLK